MVREVRGWIGSGSATTANSLRQTVADLCIAAWLAAQATTTVHHALNAEVRSDIAAYAIASLQYRYNFAVLQNPT